MLDEPLQRLPGQVEPIEGRIAPFELGGDAQALRVVVEAVIGGERLVERPLAGVTEGRMPKIVREGEPLGQVLVESERSGDRPGDLGDLERVSEARAEMVALVVDEDLRLVLQPPEGVRMDDPVAVALKSASEGGRPARRRGAPAICAGSEA